MHSLELKLPPPLVGALVAVLMWGLAHIYPMLPFPSNAKFVIAILLALSALLFDLLGLLAFRRSGTTINPLQPDKASALVTDGIYRISRNPMYVGLALLLTAWAVYLSAAWPFIGPILFVLYIDRFQIRPEERILGLLFGHAYADYARRVPRWIGPARRA